MVDLCSSVAIFLFKWTSTSAQNIDRLTLVSLTASGSTELIDARGRGVDERGVAAAATEVNQDEKNPPVFCLTVKGCRDFFSEPEAYTQCIT